jgi:hypothetical protein
MANRDAACRAPSFPEPRVHWARFTGPPVLAHPKFDASTLRNEIGVAGLFSEAVDVQENVGGTRVDYLQASGSAGGQWIGRGSGLKTDVPPSA